MAQIKLSSQLFDYLSNNLPVENIRALYKTPSRTISTELFFEIDEEAADQIRDWASDRLQKVGFDDSYALTSEGEILNALIDAFYIR